MADGLTIKELITALNYPGTAPDGVRDFVFLVDGLEIHASEQVNGIVLRFALPCSDELIPDFAQYAAGRLLREDAVLARDGQDSPLFIWQLLPLPADEGMLRESFERFADSCEWWLSRCAEREVPQSVFPDILIRP